jgi:CRP-like cAMP-binding protein
MINIQYFSRRSHLNLNRADTWRIEKGIVRATSWLADGSLTTLGFWGSGDILGNFLFQHQNYELECLTAVTASPLLYPHCEDRAMLNHLQQLEQLLLVRSCKRIEDMLMQLLAWLGQKFGDREENGLRLRFPLTHQDLAETLSTTRVTITRSLRQLEERGSIQRLEKGQTLIIRSATAIEPVHFQIPKQVRPSIDPVPDRQLSYS